MEYVDVLKALSDENRLKIMCILSSGTPCVCHLESTLEISQSSTSKHLQRLKAVGLIESDKKGQWVHYTIPDTLYDTYPFIKVLLESLLADGRYQNLIKDCQAYQQGEETC